MQYVLYYERRLNMTFREIEKMLKRDGWYYYDAVGSHIQYKHKIKPRKSNNSKTWRRYKIGNIKFNLKTSRFKIKKMEVV